MIKTSGIKGKMNSKYVYLLSTGILYLSMILFGSCTSEWFYEPEKFITPVFNSTKNIIVGPDTISNFIGHKNVKIVYLDGVGKKRKLMFINYADTQKAIKPVSLHMPIENNPSFQYPSEAPKISPDGNWVTYFQTDGVTSITFVQKLDTSSQPILFETNAAHPHWFIDNESKLYIVYCKETSGDALLEDTLTGYTKKQEVSLHNPSQKIGQPQEIIKGKSFNGGLTPDGKYCFTGDYRSYLFDMDQKIILPINQGVQTCNASVSPDTGSRGHFFMFLNISGYQKLANDKQTYLQHEIIYIVNKDNEAVHRINHNTLFGSGYGEWQDPEWSNHPEFLITLLENNDSERNKIPQTSYECIIVRLTTLYQTLQINNPNYLGLSGDASPELWIGNK